MHLSVSAPPPPPPPPKNLLQFHQGITNLIFLFCSATRGDYFFLFVVTSLPRTFKSYPPSSPRGGPHNLSVYIYLSKFVNKYKGGLTKDDIKAKCVAQRSTLMDLVRSSTRAFRHDKARLSPLLLCNSINTSQRGWMDFSFFMCFQPQPYASGDFSFYICKGRATAGVIFPGTT